MVGNNQNNSDWSSVINNILNKNNTTNTTSYNSLGNVASKPAYNYLNNTTGSSNYGLGSIQNQQPYIESSAYLSGNNGGTQNNLNNSGSFDFSFNGLMDNFQSLGSLANTANSIFGAYQAFDSIFGSGRKDRKNARDIMKKSFEQNYAMNQMTMDKFKEDNARFKQDRANITNSYMNK